MKPELGIIGQMEGGIRHVLMLWRPAHTEIVLTIVEPRNQITRAVKFGKVQLAISRQKITITIVDDLISVGGCIFVAATLPCVLHILTGTHGAGHEGVQKTLHCVCTNFIPSARVGT
jgi:hypothetical protein